MTEREGNSSPGGGPEMNFIKKITKNRDVGGLFIVTFGGGLILGAHLGKEVGALIGAIVGLILFFRAIPK